MAEDEKQAPQEAKADEWPDWFANRLSFDDEAEIEADEDYKAFVDKFKRKLTTDDCYTPAVVYDAVANWCVNRYHVKRENFVRPFYPGGDYKKTKYSADAVVVDNPPFSILTEIVNFYQKRKIKFFLFAPALTLTNHVRRCTAICTGNEVVYDNGASISTSFLTNMEDYEKACIMSAPDLYAAVDKANEETLEKVKKRVPKYVYPSHVATAAIVQKYSKWGIDYAIPRKRCIEIGALDAQRPYGKSIFGGGLLLSERAAAERAAATVWELSPRERFFVEYLSSYDGDEEKEKETK